MRRNSQSVGFGLNEEGWMSVMDLRVCVGWPAVMGEPRGRLRRSPGGEGL